MGKKVIEAQQVAILELKKESGDVGDDAEVNSADAPDSHARSADAAVGSSVGGRCGAADVAGAADDSEQQLRAAEAEIAAKTQQMLALLQQADDMQRALHQLEALDPSSLNELHGSRTAPAPDSA